MTSVQPVLSIPIIPADVDLVSRVEAARRAKGNSPFVGIATPKGTIMLRRDVLKKSLQGLKIVEAEIVTPEPDGTDEYHGMIRGNFIDDSGWRAQYQAVAAIRVYAVGEHVKATRLYIPQPWKHSPLLETWQRANLRKMGRCDCYEFERYGTCKHLETVKRGKESNYQKAIRKLEGEMPREWRPENPALPKYTPEPASDSERRQWHTWKLQKDTRRAVMALARRGTKDLSSSKMYAEVAKLTAPHFQMTNWDAVFNGPRGDDRPEPMYTLAVEPITVKKWGDLNTAERRSTEDLFAYLKKLWQFCGLTSKPYRDRTEPTWGAKHYQRWLEDMHTRKQLTEQIAAIKAEERARQ